MVVLLGCLIVAVLFVVVFLWICFNPAINIYSVAHQDTQEKRIALTFDDGPAPGRTEKVLQILADMEVQATFFIVGKNARQYPKLIRQTAMAGHLLANHSFQHDRLTPLWPRTAVRDLRATSAAIEAASGHAPVFYRPPFGFRTPWSAKAIRAAGYQIVTWSVITHDYFRQSKDGITREVIAKASPGGVIVLHDGHEGMGLATTHMPEALPGIIAALREQGYHFVRLDELFNITGYMASSHD